jgi:hypothetical protein
MGYYIGGYSFYPTSSKNKGLPMLVPMCTLGDGKECPATCESLSVFSYKSEEEIKRIQVCMANYESCPYFQALETDAVNP